MIYKDGDDVKPTPVTDRAWDILSEHILSAPGFFSRVMGTPRRAEDGTITHPAPPRPVDISRLFAFAEQAASEIKSEIFGPFATLYLTGEELQVIEDMLTSACNGMDAALEVAQSDVIQEALRERWSFYNSLRTAFAEARYAVEREDSAGSGVRPLDGDDGRPEDG